jgi:PmbA protein
MSAGLPAGEEALLAHVLDRVKQAGAHSADAVVVESDSLEVRVRGEEVEVVSQARERALGVRAFVAGAAGLRVAISSTRDLSRATVDRIADECVALAKSTAEDPTAGLPDGGFARDVPDLALFDPADRGVGTQDRIDAAFAAERAARGADPRIANSEGSAAGSDFSRVAYASSAGFSGSYASAAHSLASSPIARDGSQMQVDYWYTTARRLAELEAPEAVGRRAAERALARLGAKKIATCEVPVIFDALSARSLLGSLVACLSGYAVYRMSSVLAGKLGERVASERITIVDDGRKPGGLGSKPFDGEGLPTARKLLVERGVLGSYLLDCYSARKLGLRSTGNAARSAGSAPGVAPTNLWIEPGAQTQDEIVRETPRGLLVTGMLGHGFNPVTGDFSRGAYGFWIEGGERAHPVEEITVAGNLLDMLKDVDAVGRDLLWMGSTASPSLRVARMTVAGA